MPLLYLGSAVGKRNIYFCSAVSVVVSLGMHRWWVPVPCRKGRDCSLWVASSGIFEAPTGDIQERKGKLDVPERSS